MGMIPFQEIPQSLLVGKRAPSPKAHKKHCCSHRTCEMSEGFYLEKMCDLSKSIWQTGHSSSEIYFSRWKMEINRSSNVHFRMGRIYFLSFLCFPQRNYRKWLDFCHFLNALKNIFLPDINGQIIKQNKKTPKIHNEAKFSVRTQALRF